MMFQNPMKDKLHQTNFLRNFSLIFSTYTFLLYINLTKNKIVILIDRAQNKIILSFRRT